MSSSFCGKKNNNNKNTIMNSERNVQKGLLSGPKFGWPTILSDCLCVSVVARCDHLQTENIGGVSRSF